MYPALILTGRGLGLRSSACLNHGIGIKRFFGFLILVLEAIKLGESSTQARVRLLEIRVFELELELKNLKRLIKNPPLEGFVQPELRANY